MFYLHSFYFHTIWFLIYKTTNWYSIIGDVDVNGAKSVISSYSKTTASVGKINATFLYMDSFFLLRTCQRVTGEPIIAKEHESLECTGQEEKENQGKPYCLNRSVRWTDGECQLLNTVHDVLVWITAGCFFLVKNLRKASPIHSVRLKHWTSSPSGSFLKTSSPNKLKATGPQKEHAQEEIL